MNKFLMVIFLLVLKSAVAQSESIVLWPNGIPGALEDSGYVEQQNYDALGDLSSLSQISVPTLTPFLANPHKAIGTAVIICPGGGYTHLAIKKEGYKVAKWLNSLGISAFVLKYRMPSDRTMQDKTIGPLQDVQQAIRIVRRQAKNWSIAPDKIGILGFSAGGHLASTAATHYNDNVYEVTDEVSARPDFSVLVYPVISMENGITHMGSRKALLGDNAVPDDIRFYSNANQVTSKTPPTFLVHATDDSAVPVENSLTYYMALKNNNVPAEMHIYENGGHGFGLGNAGTNTYWPKDLKHWLEMNSYIKSSDVYLFSYFKGNGEDGLHLAFSEDGYAWQSLQNDTSFLTPEVGKDKLMRDPCIIVGEDGTFHMVWTVSWTDKGIGYASSKDLKHWSKQQFIPVMAHEPNTRNTWAPEITYDKVTQNYMIYWASTVSGKFSETKSDKENGYNHRLYYTLTKDFNNFTPTKLLYDPGFNVIDATIKKWEGKYLMFLKDETVEPVEKNIKIAVSDNVEGPYGDAGKPITGNYWAEGPTATLIDGKWTVYFDKYRNHAYGAVQSSNLTDWTDISDKIQFPEGTRHGTIFKVPREVLDNLQR